MKESKSDILLQNIDILFIVIRSTLTRQVITTKRKKLFKGTPDYAQSCAA